MVLKTKEVSLKQFMIAAILGIAIRAFAVTPIEKSSEHTFILSGTSGIQIGSKWPIGEFNEKGLRVRVDDPAVTSSDSCGFNLFLYGWSEGYGCRLGFHAVPLVLHTAYKTLENGQSTTVDTSIVIDNAATSVAMDANTDMVQIAPICCFDSIQVRLAPNARTKKANSITVRVRLVQINPHAQNN